jgi:hypothetical protein
MKRTIPVVISLVLALTVSAKAAVYLDEAVGVINTNDDIDAVAVGSSYTTWQLWNSALGDAFANDNGGVWDVDGNGRASDMTQEDIAFGASLNKTFTVSTGEDMQLFGFSSTDETSGSGMLNSKARDGSYTLTFSGEPIGQFGFVALSRDGYSQTVVATAAFSGGGSAQLTDEVAEGAGIDNTLFVFSAPSGEAITSISLSNGTIGDPDINEGEGDVLAVDDLGFIVVPEPATMSLLGLGGLVALRRRRR